MKRDDVKELIERFYEMRRAGALEPMLACFTPDPTLTLNGHATTSPLVGRWSGATTVRDVATQLLDVFDFDRIDIRSRLIDADEAVAHVVVRIRHKPSGNIIETEIADMFKIADGRIAAMTQFVDTAHLNRATSA